MTTMRSLTTLVLRAALALPWAMAWSGVAGSAPLEAYGKLPSIEDVAISADASRVAAIVTEGDARRIVVKRLSDGVIEASVAVGDVKARNIAWAGRDHLIITTSTTTSNIRNGTGPRGEYYTVLDLDMRDRKLYPLMNDARNAINITAGDPMSRVIDGRLTLLVPGYSFGATGGAAGRPALFKVDLDTHKVSLSWTSPDFMTRYVVDDRGVVVAMTTYDHEEWTLKVRQGDAWRDVKVIKTKTDQPLLLGVGRTTDAVLVTEDTPDGKVVREISVASPSWPEPSVRIGQGGAIRYGPNHLMVGTIDYVGDDIRFSFFDAANERRWAAIRAAFPGQLVIPVSEADDPGKLLVYVESATEGPAFAFVDGRKAEWIGPAYQDLTTEDLSAVRPLKFKAADGLDLTGYVTLPHGRPAKGLPLVVLPHSGPNERDAAVFDWLAQAIASRGYAVLKVNYRGSYGFGKTFLEAGYGQMGRGMQTDLSDGVRYLVREGVVDAARVCIAGTGYGGYAALAGVAFEPQVYRCAVSIGGQSDWKRDMEWRNAGGRRFFLRYAGVEDIMDPRLKAISPALHPEGITAPVLLIHGRDDTSTSLEQSQAMQAALRKKGKPVEFEVLAGEDHWLSRSATRLKALQLVIAFLEKNNPPN